MGLTAQTKKPGYPSLQPNRIDCEQPTAQPAPPPKIWGGFSGGVPNSHEDGSQPQGQVIQVTYLEVEFSKGGMDGGSAVGFKHLYGRGDA